MASKELVKSYGWVSIFSDGSTYKSMPILTFETVPLQIEYLKNPVDEPQLCSNGNYLQVIGARLTGEKNMHFFSLFAAPELEMEAPEDLFAGIEDGAWVVVKGKFIPAHNRIDKHGQPVLDEDGDPIRDPQKFDVRKWKVVADPTPRIPLVNLTDEPEAPVSEA